MAPEPAFDTPTFDTLDDFRAILNDLPGPDEGAAALAAAREPALTKPAGALGRMEDISAWLAAWQGHHPPRMETPAARVFAGNHGVTRRGVSAFPGEVTVQMVANFAAGGAAINQICGTFDIDLKVEALDLETPTNDFSETAAMSDTKCADALKRGWDAIDGNSDVVCLGEMGIGNTTSAAAICHALYGGTAAGWTGPGTGVTGDARTAKEAVVAESVTLHTKDSPDSISILARLGGRELAAIVGAIAAARFKRVPVLLDGYVCTAAAATLEKFCPGALDHCQVAHVSTEPGHRQLLERLDKRALLDLGMRLGEASGAALAVGILRAAVNCHVGMATFADAGVSDRDDD